MSLNAGKTMTISRSRTVLPCLPELTLNDVALKETSELIILGVTFEPKLTFERTCWVCTNLQFLKEEVF